MAGDGEVMAAGAEAIAGRELNCQNTKKTLAVQLRGERIFYVAATFTPALAAAPFVVCFALRSFHTSSITSAPTRP
jgi:hypothetical protein